MLFHSHFGLWGSSNPFWPLYTIPGPCCGLQRVPERMVMGHQAPLVTALYSIPSRVRVWADTICLPIQKGLTATPYMGCTLLSPRGLKAALLRKRRLLVRCLLQVAACVRSFALGCLLFAYGGRLFAQTGNCVRNPFYGVPRAGLRVPSSLTQTRWAP